MHAGSLATGTKIGRFVIESLIGAGGMGEVYAARDTQLARTVALKILPASRAAEADRVERFLREARAASSLNHPAIVTIFDSGSETLPEGEIVHYLAMELIDGVTLTEWTRARRNRNKILEVLAQVAEGLARAHSGGIVHRDLKPDNIMVAKGGFAKIVDFGIAKLTERSVVDTVALADTAPSSILGTTSFMSPEQVEGRPVDSRSDVFAFGCVLFAALQGKSPFERDSPVKTMHAIVNEATPALPEAPAWVERIARRCLAKDPEERYQSIKDVALDLREHMPSQSDIKSRHRLYRLLAILTAAAILSAATWFAQRAGAAKPPDTARVETKPMTMQRLTNSGKIATGGLSPDGKYVVYASDEGDEQSLWLRQVATGTDILLAEPAERLYEDIRVSPDGNYVFFSYAARNEPNVVNVYRMPILGGEARKVIDDIESGFGVSPDGSQLVFRRFSAVTRVQTLHTINVDDGAERQLLAKKFPEAFGSPSWTPDGQRITFTFGNQITMRKPNIVDLDLATNRLTRIATPEWYGFGGISWVPDGSGFVLTAVEQQQPPQLWYLPLNGQPRKITSDVAYYRGVSFTSDSRSFVAHRAEESANVWQVDVASGKARALTSGHGSFAGSAGVRWIDGQQILYTVAGAEHGTYLRVMDARNGQSRAIPRVVGWRPSLSPDRKRIAYITGRGRLSNLWVCNIDGTDARRVSDLPVGSSTPSWTPDGKSVIVISAGESQVITRIWIDDGRTQTITDRPANSPALSPDGEWIICRLRSLEPNVPLWRTAIIRMDGTAPPRYLGVPLGGGPHVFEWMPDGKRFAFIDTRKGVANIFIQDVAGGPPRQVSRFDSGKIATFDFSDDLESLVVAKVEWENDLVLIRDFR